MVLTAVLQIFLMINTIPSESYIISQTNSFTNAPLVINNNFENLEGLMSKTFGLFFSFLSLKQIGIVSAEDLNLNCCPETNSGALCQNVPSGLSGSDPESCASPLPTRCESTSECALGTCVINSGESCSANSPKNACEANSGTWYSGSISTVSECLTGACVIGSNVQLTTEKQCEIQSQAQGLNTDFRPGLSELDFPQILETLKKGACILSGNTCRFGTIGECSSSNGKFYENLLCTNPYLDTNCQPTEQTTCLGEKVYFVDSCGNTANVYDATKVNAGAKPDYWSSIQGIDSACDVNINDASTLENCGNCNRFASTLCTSKEESSIQPSYGDFVCKNLVCIDEKGNKKSNGEKWCVYDSFTGDGKDPAGSEQYIASCDNGKVNVNVCGTARGQLCTQKIIEENGKEFSTAACVVNQAIKCFDYNNNLGADEEKCNANSQCQVANVDVDQYFKLSMCVPQYPKGFSQKDQSGTNNKICAIANQECTVIYQKQLKGGWKCIQNCQCETAKFAEEMNNLCVSLGDCGSYINYIGDGTNNIKVSGAPEISWEKYKEFANPEEGKYIELDGQDTYLSALSTETNVSKYTPEEANLIIAGIGSMGITAGMMAYFGGVGLWTDTIHQLSGLSEQFAFTTINEYGQTVATPLATSLTSIGISIVGGIVGAYIGKFLAESFGISGDAATVLVLAAGVGGTSAAMYLGVKYGLLKNSFVALETWGWSFVISAVVIAVIIFSGWGTTKQVKVNFECLPWQAPTGGNNCDECNGNPSEPCTKYKCESLGQACRLINENTNAPVCESLSYETIPPVIREGSVLTKEYDFQNPQIKNVQIRNINGGCIPEFVPVVFTLKTDEYAQCKWDLERLGDYESMENYHAEGTVYSLNHSFSVGGFSLGLLNANNITGDLIEGFTGNVKMFVKCKDSFGNFNLDDYVVDFCINSGPDTTPVLQSLTTTSPENGANLKYGTDEIDFKMWTNEPAECKYSYTEGLSYNEMEGALACKTNLDDHESFGWPCSGTLGNLNQNSKFYIKCLDQPWLKGTVEESERNANMEDFSYEVYISEQELKIKIISLTYKNSKAILNPDSYTEISGNEIIFPITLQAETSGGIDNGKSSCSYQWGENYIPFLNTNSNTHSQDMNLPRGTYGISIKCIDEAGNEAVQNANFKMKSDYSAPIAVRTYYDSGDLVLITNEQAKCYLSSDVVEGCNFNTDEAEKMETGFTTSHSTTWIEGKVYYIKCEDLLGNKNTGCTAKITTS